MCMCFRVHVHVLKDKLFVSEYTGTFSNLEKNGSTTHRPDKMTTKLKTQENSFLSLLLGFDNSD